MKIKRIYKFLLLIVVIIAITVPSVMQYKKVNAEMPQAVIEEYAINDKVGYEGFEILVLGYKFMDFSELDKEVKEYNTMLNESDGKVLLVDIKVVNNNKDKKKLDIDASVQSNAYSNNFDIELYYYYNDTGFTLGAGEEQTYKLPYTIFKYNFTEKAWSELNQRKFDFVISLYPVKRTVSLYNKF